MKIFKTCSVIAFCLLSATSFAQKIDLSMQAKPKIYWKHNGCIDKGGFCIRHIFNHHARGEALAEGEGTFNYEIDDNNFIVYFDGTGGPVDGYFPVDNGVPVGENLSSTFSKQSFTLKGGNYKVNYSESHRYGFAIIPILN